MSESSPHGGAVGIAVTQLEYTKARAVFEAAGARGLRCVSAPDDEVGLADAIRTQALQHAIVGVTRYTGPLYTVLPSGSVLARFGVGHDGVDKAAATRAGLLCTNTPGALDDSVAEYAIALMMAAARYVPRLAEGTRAGGWSPILGTELHGKTLAVIGCGAIGSRVAVIASRGLGMRVIGCETSAEHAERARSRCAAGQIVWDFASAVRDADFVTLHIPSLPETRYFINAARLGAMKPGAWLINTARGAVVDERALFAALASGRLAGAALDVFENESYKPVDAGVDLRLLPNVIMTPHVSSSTQEACDRMANRALRNIELAVQGRFTEMDLLNREVLTGKT